MSGDGVVGICPDCMGCGFSNPQASSDTCARCNGMGATMPSEAEQLWAALRKLEAACDDLAANRSRETYRNMVDCDRATPYLHALDEARREARTILRAIDPREIPA